MEQPTLMEEKKTFLQNDRKLVCLMLVIYGVCILGFMGAVFWGLDHRSKQISANATSTAASVATRASKRTATAAAHATDQAQYKYIDSFNNNQRGWLTKTTDDEFMKGLIAINGGIYAWNIQEVKQPFIYWSHFNQGSKFEDFDVYVDSRVAEGLPGDACSGFIFRTASFDWQEGAYTFSVCNDSYFYVKYYKKGKWESISHSIPSYTIQNNDWNRLGISARGDHFIFTINNEVVYEMTDDRQPNGGLALLIDVNEERPVSIWFDNFGLQPR